MGTPSEPETPHRPLEGQVTLVTGGAVRLGGMISRAVAEAGGCVAIHYHSSATDAEALVDELSASGATVRACQADLTSPQGCRVLLDRVHATMGPIHCLVNSAALFEPGSLKETTPEIWTSQMDLNLRAPFLLTQHFVAQLPADQRGSVLNILDARLRRPAGDYLAYRLSKAALLHFTQCLAADLAPRIRVNALAPGAILPRVGESKKGMGERLQEAVPLGLEGASTSIGRSALELLSNPFLTGQITYLDGGQFL